MTKEDGKGACPKGSNARTFSTPNHDEKDGEEVKHLDAQRVEVRDDKSHTSGTKESMVAEPSIKYKSTNIRF